jgi:hypothetical protein
MTRPLDVFRSQTSITTNCQAFYPDDQDSSAACVHERVTSAQAETFGLLVGAAIGILIGRFAFHGRR